MAIVENPVETSEVQTLSANAAPDAWRSLLARIREKVNEQTFITWFNPLRFAGVDGDRLVIDAPGEFFVDWIEEHYLGFLTDAAAECFRPNLKIVFRVDPGSEPVLAPEAVQISAAAPAPARNRLFPDDSSLDPRYTFDTFVSGPSNQFAHAACVAVAEKPAHSYNPLFLYGGVGLGKTHLMQAIGNQLRQRNSACRIFYLSSEQFMNEMIESIQRNRTLDFKNKYRNADLLLIDDIQFLAGKETTQEEFFHTFNALFDAHKQIVVSSDRPPKEIPTLEERLISRFHWGLVADIQAPEMETRVAIIKRKAEVEGVHLPDDVAHLIAANVRSNIRELEGSLVRLVAYSSLTRRDITMELARDVLKILGDANAVPPIDAPRVMDVVAEHFHVTIEALKGRKRTNQIAYPRQTGMYLCRTLTQMSLVEIGEAFGGRDHTTVIYACDRIGELYQVDRDVRNDIDRLNILLRDGRAG
jgi:chromosomal replication initiator protein